MRWLWVAAALTAGLAGCSAGAPPAASASYRVYAVSATPTAAAEPGPAAPAPTAASTPAVPTPTPTLGPVIFTLDFTAERRDDVTLHVGQALHLIVARGPSGDWISGVDDARVLRPMSPDGSGVFQAMRPGSALLTAHVLAGCAQVTPAEPCRNPERGLWFQTRVYVVP